MLAMIGLGSNQGDRLGYLHSAVADLLAGEIERTRVLAASRIYETRPVGPSKDPYLNAALSLESELEPAALLRGLKHIEDRHGRVREVEWGPRTLDLDFLLARRDGAWITLRTDTLRLPHPEVFARDFVMRPLLDLDPDLTVAGVHLASQLAQLEPGDRTLLRVLDETLLPG